MCGRYSLAPAEFSEIQLAFSVEAALQLAPRYNIAPTWAPGYEPPIIILPPDGARRIVLARWWMIPNHWARPLRALPTAFNARAEELGQKRFWAGSFESRRCLVPSTGWREFRGPSGQRQAFQFHYEQQLFAFAGLWDVWASPAGEAIQSFAIVTVAANDTVAKVHDRMPLRVDPELYATWLDPALSGAAALAPVLAAAQGAEAAPLSCYEADPLGNDTRREGPECIAPVRRAQLGLFD